MCAHCLVCNLSLEEQYKYLNIFNLVDFPTEELPKSVTQSNTLFEIIARILNRPQSSIILHSHVLCQGCHSKVLAIIEVQNKLQKLQKELISSFDQTAFAQTKLASTNYASQELTESLTSNESNIKTELASTNAASLELAKSVTSNANIKTELASTNDSSQELTVPVMSIASNVNTAKSLLDLTSIDFGKSSFFIDSKVPEKHDKNKSPLSEQTPAVDEQADIEKQYDCVKCGKTFSGNNCWVEHMLNHIDKKPHICCLCNQQFQSLSSLKAHEKGHIGLKPYQCELCGKSFSERHYLTEHASVHTNCKPFKCSVCEREFGRRKDMMTHVKLHSEDRPYPCPQCPKKFVVNSRLNRHLKTHSVERPYQCKTCQKTFIRFNDFQNHERQHTGEKPFTCPECNKCFGNLSNYRAHERRHQKARKKEALNANLISKSLDPLHLQGTLVRDREAAASKEQSNKTTLVKTDEVGKEIPINRHSQEMVSESEPVIFPVGEGEQDEVFLSPRLPSLVNFKNPPESNKSTQSTLPLDTDLSNVALASNENNITAQHQHPLVLMQLPMLQGPPPLVLYSAPCTNRRAIRMTDAMLVGPAQGSAPGPAPNNNNNNLSQLQVLRWDTGDDVLFHNNPQLLTQNLF